MTKQRSSAAVLIALVLVLTPLVLYVGAYLWVVEPFGQRFKAAQFDAVYVDDLLAGKISTGNYRSGGQLAATVFWPVEQLDRRVRRDYWRRPTTIEATTLDGQVYQLRASFQSREEFAELEELARQTSANALTADPASAGGQAPSIPRPLIPPAVPTQQSEAEMRQMRKLMEALEKLQAAE